MDDFKSWALKVIIPSLIAISIKLAVQSKRGVVSWFNVISSFITGIGSAYLCADLVMETFAHQYVPIVIAIITISGEKIGFWLVYKMNVESILEGLVKKYKGK
jgi:hypothetical protein